MHLHDLGLSQALLKIKPLQDFNRYPSYPGKGSTRNSLIFWSGIFNRYIKEMKRYSSYILLAVFGLFIAAIIIFRKDMMDGISESRSGLIPADEKAAISEKVSGLFDYTGNGKDYSYTFLEFGSTGCISCRQMEKVMETIRSEYQDVVNVVFINVALKENQDLAEYYGIVTIPTQVLLDRNGKEYYRHHGYIPAEELSRNF